MMNEHVFNKLLTKNTIISWIKKKKQQKKKRAYLAALEGVHTFFFLVQVFKATFFFSFKNTIKHLMKNFIQNKTQD